MFYDLNIPWPEDVFKAASNRNALYEPYIRQMNQYIAGEHAPADAVQGGAKKKMKKGKPAAPAPADTSRTPTNEPPQKPPQLTPFDALCGLSSAQKARVEALTVDLFELGYRHVAYNHTVVARFNPAQHQNPLFDPRTKSTRPPFPALDPKTKVTFRRQQQQSAVPTEADARRDVSLEQLSRLTIVLNADSFGKAGHGLGSSSTNALLTYDLLAVCPTNEAAFSLTCTSLTELKPQSIDIISLDFAAASRLPFMLKRSSISAAIQNGAVIEVCYGSLAGVEDVYALQRHAQDGELERAASLSPEARARARRNLIAGVKDLLRITKGHNVIFSSGVADVLGLRGPADIMNLAAIFGMQPAAAKKALSDTAQSLVKRAQTRKTWRGIVGPPRLRLLPVAPMLSVPNPADDMADIIDTPTKDVTMAPSVDAVQPAGSHQAASDQSSSVSKRPREPSPSGVGSMAKPSSKRRRQSKAAQSA